MAKQATDTQTGPTLEEREAKVAEAEKRLADLELKLEAMAAKQDTAINAIRLDKKTQVRTVVSPIPGKGTPGTYRVIGRGKSKELNGWLETIVENACDASEAIRTVRVAGRITSDQVGFTAIEVKN